MKTYLKDYRVERKCDMFDGSAVKTAVRSSVRKGSQGSNDSMNGDPRATSEQSRNLDIVCRLSSWLNNNLGNVPKK